MSYKIGKVHFKTYGCSANFSESEQMMGLLKKAEFDIVNNADDSDLVVFNVCTVKGDAQSLKEVLKFKKDYPNKRIVLSGCLTPTLIKDIRKNLGECSFCNTNSLNEITSVVETTLEGNNVEVIKDYKNASVKLNLPKIRKNPVIGIIPILQGCTFQCTYCSVVQIKGKAKSYPVAEILRDVRDCANDGCKEIWLTSQDNSAYGIYEKQRTNLAELLENVVEIPGNFMVRIGMMNPILLLPYIDRLIEVYKNPKVFKFLHIPIQSGNNEVLKKMQRGYKVEHFRLIVEKFRKEIPEITISTDVICGFPGETEEQFNDTLKIIKDLKIPVLNISRFVARDGTKAAKMKQLSGGVLKERSRKITNIFSRISKEDNQKWIGWEGKILIDEEGKNGQMIGRNYAYKPVIVEGDFNIGDELYVKINNASTFDLRGEVISKQ